MVAHVLYSSHCWHFLCCRRGDHDGHRAAILHQQQQGEAACVNPANDIDDVDDDYSELQTISAGVYLHTPAELNTGGLDGDRN